MKGIVEQQQTKDWSKISKLVSSKLQKTLSKEQCRKRYGAIKDRWLDSDQKGKRFKWGEDAVRICCCLYCFYCAVAADNVEVDDDLNFAVNILHVLMFMVVL